MKNLMFAKTVSPGDDILRCRVINTSDCYVTVYHGTPLGLAQEVPPKMISKLKVEDLLSNTRPNPVDQVDLSRSSLNK